LIYSFMFVIIMVAAAAAALHRYFSNFTIQIVKEQTEGH